MTMGELERRYPRRRVFRALGRCKPDTQEIQIQCPTIHSGLETVAMVVMVAMVADVVGRQGEAMWTDRRQLGSKPE